MRRWLRAFAGPFFEGPQGELMRQMCVALGFFALAKI